MRVLTKAEKREFELTFDFINHYVGSLYFDGAKKIQDIKIDGGRMPDKLTTFIVDKFKNDIKKVNIWFNNTTEKRKETVLNSLIKYCFENRVQPHELRVIGFKTIQVQKINFTYEEYAA